MDCHLDSPLLTYRLYGLEEIDEVVEKSLFINILIRLKEFLHLAQPLGLPARHYETVGAVVCLIEEFLRID